MAYCLVGDVRERLPEIEDAESNSEIEGCIEQAQAIVDDMFRRHATVPLTGTIPASVKHGTADIAAGIFRSRRTADKAMPALYDQGVKRVEGYVNSTYRAGAFVR